MKLYDISQEVFTCAVFPGDPAPERVELAKMSSGDPCDVTAIKMCAHNGTHLDAPSHFVKGGKTIDRLALGSFVGYACVIAHEGDITGENVQTILESALKMDLDRGLNGEALKRLLIKGSATLTEEAAKVLAGRGILLYGNESQTVGPKNAPMPVHLIMLGADIVLLEGIRLGHVPEGVYFLSAAPLNLGGAEGAPCRAVLIRFAE